jgi:hypothetical protein
MAIEKKQKEKENEKRMRTGNRGLSLRAISFSVPKLYAPLSLSFPFFTLALIKAFYHVIENPGNFV